MLDDFVKRGLAIGRFPDCGRYFVQREECGIRRRHDHGFIAQSTRGNGTASCYVS
jgi:hypothetical protein